MTNIIKESYKNKDDHNFSLEFFALENSRGEHIFSSFSSSFHKMVAELRSIQLKDGVYYLKNEENEIIKLYLNKNKISSDVLCTSKTSESNDLCDTCMYKVANSSLLIDYCCACDNSDQYRKEYTHNILFYEDMKTYRIAHVNINILILVNITDVNDIRLVGNLELSLMLIDGDVKLTIPNEDLIVDEKLEEKELTIEEENDFLLEMALIEEEWQDEKI